MTIWYIRRESQICEYLGFLIKLFWGLVVAVVFFWKLLYSGIASDLTFEVLDDFFEAWDWVLVHDFGLVFETGNQSVLFLFLLCSEVFNRQRFRPNRNKPQLLELLTLSWVVDQYCSIKQIEDEHFLRKYFTESGHFFPTQNVDPFLEGFPLSELLEKL